MGLDGGTAPSRERKGWGTHCLLVSIKTEGKTTSEAHPTFATQGGF